MNIGIFGGTFDPIHIGHLVAAVNAKYSGSLDEIHLVVANIPWQKEGVRHLTPAQTRLDLVRQAVSNLKGFVASDTEIRRGGRSYTFDTLVDFRNRYPNDNLYLVVGADAAIEMHTWERGEELSDLCNLIVVTRPGFEMPDKILTWPSWKTVEIPSLDISSTDLRQRVKDGRPLDFLLPQFAIEFIYETGLFR
jgi:nicotinate-nucleotide adenylyltransferase